MDILALNCGSSSVKYQLFDWEKKQLLARGAVERVAVSDSFIVHEVPGREPVRKNHDCPDHCAAISLVLDTLAQESFNKGGKGVIPVDAVGHRVVAGGEHFTQSMLITDEVLQGIRDVQHLAPLHNPHHVSGIEAIRTLLPNVPQVAVFDTAFHQTMPERAYIYSLPYEWYRRYGVRRYGAHGSSHLYVSKRAAVLLKKAPRDCNLITLHIGNGSSFCAVRNGESVDTSMGMTPLEGAMMGTRCGDIDPAIPGFMMEREGYTAKEMDAILNKKSGVLGVTGRFSDRRDVLSHAERGNRRCLLALELEAYRIRKYIGSYTAVLGRVDALVFTAGVGEMGWKIREMALENLDCLGIRMDREKNRTAVYRDRESDISAADSKVKILIIPTNEELVLIEDVVGILNGTYKSHMEFDYSFTHEDFKIG
ncbi:MAG: acetate kinase [Deltaproteobacteria bacterium]|nr:acetate kinase [Deltaproteobacteria bacterium]